MTIQYDGTKYDGWQRLGNSPDKHSIQGEIEKQLTEILGEEVTITGSGRTDSGVHAIGQIANFTTNKRIDCYSLNEKLNCKLPEDIRVTDIVMASINFHSRYFAVDKTYEYYIDNSEVQSVFSRKYTFHIPEKLDLKKMQIGAEYLLGTHDFKGFSSAMKDGRPTVKNLFELKVNEVKELPFTNINNKKKNEKFIIFTIRADGFLYNMVRIIIGTLVEIGLGIKEPESIKTILKEKDRQLSGYTIGSQGLFLKEVNYQ